MAYLSISDFKFGLDRRRPRVAGIPGTLWNIKNAHLTRGGDIERAKKFVPLYGLPDGTFGMGQVGGQLYVFGSANLSASMPVGVQYQRLESPSGAGMSGILSVKTFDRKLYVIAEYADGNIYHFYNGARVSGLDALSDSNSNLAAVAAYIADRINTRSDVVATAFGNSITVRAITPGVAFTMTASTVDAGGVNDQTIIVSTVQPNVAALAETRATATVTITGGTFDPGVNAVSNISINGVNLLGSNPVNWVTSNSATANRLAQEVNNRTSATGYSATASGAVVAIQAAPGTGATPNGYVVAVTNIGNVTTTKTNVAGGVAAVSAVAQIGLAVFSGTFQAADRFTVTINGTGYNATGRASGSGTSAFVFKRRMWLTSASLLRYCKINDPSDWTDTNIASGAGFINASNESEGSERLTVNAEYSGRMAVVAPSTIRVYDISTDAQQNTLIQTLENTGTIAGRSVVSYGNNDVFYLDTTGIRSLRARDSSNAAYVSDIGTSIDPFVRAWVDSQPEETVRRAVGVVEPIDGRFWLAVGARVFVLSYFPGAKISAWSYYEPGFSITDFARIRDQIFARAGNTIYLYGGLTGQEYPAYGEQPVEVETPFMSASTPATVKMLTGFDMACENTWDVDILVDPNDSAKAINVGKVRETTYSGPHVAVPGRTSMVAVRMSCDRPGYATVSNMSIHFESEEAR